MGVAMYLNNVVVRGVTKDTIDYKMEEVQEEIAHCKERLLMYAASSPRQVADEEDHTQDWVEYVHTEVNQLIASLQDAHVRQHLLILAKECPDDASFDY